jgi:hypothetical protein
MATQEDPQNLIRDQEGQQEEMLPRQERQALTPLPLQTSSGTSSVCA